ncbi:MAG: DEAD/DEAH box helicase [Candidatus Cloacimonetes bacterium]|nr:DEAD/DEAH box helicase [Candidatus Cloacimonadota bacterium]
MKHSENFNELGLNDESLKAITKKGFEEPTPIQALVIPLLLSCNKDIVGQAQTGTGKTAAFGLPIIEKIQTGKKEVQALILAPTRELAIQVVDEMNSYKGSRRISILPVYGGQSIDNQIRRLKQGVEIVVGTPGRIIDHLKRKTLTLDEISFMVLDEADEMLNMGFIEDIELILSKTNSEKRVLLFSATMPNRIVNLAKNFMGEYELLKVKSEQLTVNLTDQIYFEVNSSDKFEALCRIIDIEKEFYGLIFCRTKLDVDSISNKLSDRGYDAAGLHGDISQHQRERTLNSFKKKRTTILVASDVAARGIDINDLTHVINFAIPYDPEAYVHRIGRTGRAGKQGTAITFITPSEYRRLMNIQKFANVEIRKEKLPKIKDLINMKRNIIVEEIKTIIHSEKYFENKKVADKLLEDFKPDEVIAALLSHAYKDDFSEDKYVEIIEPSRTRQRNSRRSFSPDLKGKTRLFIALGRKDGMSARKLVDMIKDKAMVESRNINDVQVYDNFSFANLPFEDAEEVIRVFRNKGRDKKPLVVKAKGKEKSSQDSSQKHRGKNWRKRKN